MLFRWHLFGFALHQLSLKLWLRVNANVDVHGLRARQKAASRHDVSFRLRHGFFHLRPFETG